MNGIRIRHRGRAPQVHPSAYVAPTATLVGDVRVGPRARVMYGAVLTAEGAFVEVGEATVVCENAVLRASATAGAQPVVLGDHVFVGPHATLLGCRAERCAYLATGATVLQEARLGAGAVVAVGALVHARARVPAEFFVPPHTLAVGDPVRLLAPGDPAVPEAIAGVGFARTAFGVDAEWTDRIRRYERIAEVRVAEFGAHAGDGADEDADFGAHAEGGGDGNAASGAYADEVVGADPDDVEGSGTPGDGGDDAWRGDGAR
ncbi:gamma carbonic anhydrase family protein [Streptomyces sp. NPDC014776]|uniref:gamma carbonic anhydrase family protein n=1 Tax=unclassified Streptomyces TaxID=2593676 RepID=UPI0036FD4597